MNEIEMCLLAPVPEGHLKTAQNIVKEHGKVAFGTADPEPLSKLPSYVDGRVDVFIYVSIAKTPPTYPPAVTWGAKFIKCVSDVDPKYRPSSTAGEEWKAYWLVADLRPLSNAIPVSCFSGLKSKLTYSEAFVPRRPLVTRRPSPRLP